MYYIRFKKSVTVHRGNQYKYYAFSFAELKPPVEIKYSTLHPLRALSNELSGIQFQASQPSTYVSLYLNRTKNSMHEIVERFFTTRKPMFVSIS